MGSTDADYLGAGADLPGYWLLANVGREFVRSVGDVSGDDIDYVEL